MPITLDIYFADLIAFVEHDDRFWALMPKTGDDTHYPQLIFLEEYLTAGVPDSVYRDYGLLNLMARDAKISQPSRAGGMQGGTYHTDVLPTGNEDQYSRVVPMADMKNDHDGDVKPEVFNCNPSDLLASRFSINSGRLSSCHYASATWLNSNRFMHAYEFKTETSSADLPLRAITNCVKAEVDIEGDQVDFVYRNMDKTDERTLSFKPNPNNRVELIIGNLGDISDQSGKVENENLNHFAYFYDLVKNWHPKNRFIPHRATWSTHRQPENRSNMNENWPPNIIGGLNVRAHEAGPGVIQSVILDLESCPQVRLARPKAEES